MFEFKTERSTWRINDLESYICKSRKDVIKKFAKILNTARVGDVIGALDILHMTQNVHTKKEQERLEYFWEVFNNEDYMYYHTKA